MAVVLVAIFIFAVFIVTIIIIWQCKRINTRSTEVEVIGEENEEVPEQNLPSLQYISESETTVPPAESSDQSVSPVYGERTADVGGETLLSTVESNLLPPSYDERTNFPLRSSLPLSHQNQAYEPESLSVESSFPFSEEELDFNTLMSSRQHNETQTTAPLTILHDPGLPPPQYGELSQIGQAPPAYDDRASYPLRSLPASNESSVFESDIMLPSSLVRSHLQHMPLILSVNNSSIQTSSPHHQNEESQPSAPPVEIHYQPSLSIPEEPFIGGDSFNLSSTEVLPTRSHLHDMPPIFDNIQLTSVNNNFLIEVPSLNQDNESQPTPSIEELFEQPTSLIVESRVENNDFGLFIPSRENNEYERNEATDTPERLNEQISLSISEEIMNDDGCDCDDVIEFFALTSHQNNESEQLTGSEGFPFHASSILHQNSESEPTISEEELHDRHFITSEDRVEDDIENNSNYITTSESLHNDIESESTVLMEELHQPSLERSTESAADEDSDFPFYAPSPSQQENGSELTAPSEQSNNQTSQQMSEERLGHNVTLISPTRTPSSSYQNNESDLTAPISDLLTSLTTPESRIAVYIDSENPFSEYVSDV